MAKNILWVKSVHINWDLSHFQSAQDAQTKDPQQMYLDSVFTKIVSFLLPKVAPSSVIPLNCEFFLWFWQEVLGFMLGHSSSGKANFNTPLSFLDPELEAMMMLQNKWRFFCREFSYKNSVTGMLYGWPHESKIRSNFLFFPWSFSIFVVLILIWGTYQGGGIVASTASQEFECLIAVEDESIV